MKTPLLRSLRLPLIYLAPALPSSDSCRRATILCAATSPAAAQEKSAVQKASEDNRRPLLQSPGARLPGARAPSASTQERNSLLCAARLQLRTRQFPEASHPAPPHRIALCCPA